MDWKPGDGIAVYRYISAIWILNAGEKGKKGRLSTSRGAKDADQLTLLSFKGKGHVEFLVFLRYFLDTKIWHSFPPFLRLRILLWQE